MPAQRDGNGRFIKGGSGVSLEGDWDRMDRALETFTQKLAVNMGVANELIGRKFIATAQRKIRAKEYAKNSPITIILKGSSTPLVEHGDLFNAITYELVTPYSVRVGVIKNKVGDEKVSIAVKLHEGYTIDVRHDPARRQALFDALHRSSSSIAQRKPAQRKAMASASVDMLFGVGSGGSSTPGIWVVPPRPFVARVLRDPAFVSAVLGAWSDATLKTLKEM